MTRYRLYGSCCDTDFVFRNSLPTMPGPVAGSTLSVTFSWQPGSMPPPPPERIWPPPDEGPEPALSLAVGIGGELELRFAGISSFSILRDRIHCRAAPSARSEILEIQFLGMVMALWLESRGVSVFHASAVSTAEGTVAFAGRKGAGKTSTVAHLLSGGAGLLSEDLLAVSAAALAQPGYPQMRLWPAEAQRFLGRTEGLEAVHPRYAKLRVPVGPGGLGSFCGDPQPLGAIFLLEPVAGAGGRAGATRLAPQVAVMELIRHSFLPEITEALGLGARRLGLLAQLAQRVPVYRLVRPAGLEHLPEVAEVVARSVIQTPVTSPPGR